MNIFFSSDFHIGHQNIISYCNRNYSSVEEMNEALIDNHNKVVKPNDLVIDVGDFSLNENYVEPTLKRMNGKRILVMGNHDKCFPSRKKASHFKQKYIEWGFADVLLQHTIDIGGHNILINHMPYEADDRHGERYAEYRPKDEGSWLIHGHVHTSWKQKGRQINVGVDVRDYAPIHIDEIASIILRGPVNA